MESTLARDDASDNSPRPLSNLARCRVQSETFAVDSSHVGGDDSRQSMGQVADEIGLPEGDEIFFLLVEM